MEPLTADDPQTVGDFRLRARLGAGGMGRVYLATSLAGRFVAVKVIHPQFSGDQDFATRFRGEASAAQRVSGLYTAPVVAAGVDDRPAWLATAFVPGPSLESIVTQHGPLPLPALWRLGAGLAEALRAIHSAGLVHRDLKPPNVILAADGPRVIDFGIARVVADERLTATGSVIGTPAYMSPEQVEGLAARSPTDVFALGCVLGFAASGRSPFDAGPEASAASIMYRVARAEPDLAAVPPEARGLIAACLAKDPARRPDPGQVATECAAAGGPADISPTAFWPDSVAAVIGSQQATVNAEVQALASGTHPATQVAARPAPGPHPSTQLAGVPGPGTHPGTQLSGWPGPGTHPGTQLAGLSGPAHPATAGAHPATGSPAPPGVPGMPTATVGPPAFPPARPASPSGPGTQGVLGPPGAPWAPSRQPGYQLRPYPSPTAAPQGTSRRGLLIGAGIAAAVAAIGGGTAWALSGGSGPAKPGTAVWAFSTGSQEVDASPTVADGVVYFGGSSDMLYAVTAATGRQLWATSVSKVSAAPAAASGLVFASSEKGDFYVIHGATGQQVWSVFGSSLDPFQKDFATNGKTVALALGDTNVSMFDAAAGTQLWSVATDVDTGFGQTVAMSGNVVYAFSVGGTLVTLDAANGKQTGTLGKPLGTSSGNGTGIVVSGGVLYFGEQQGPLYAQDIKTGRVKWTYRPTGGAYPQSDPVVSDGMVYFADNNGLVHAVHTATGLRAWTYSTGGQDGATGPGAGGGRAYVCTNKGLQQLDGKTGRAGWTFSLSTGVLFTSTPAVAGGLVFCGNADGNLYAVKA